MKIEFVQVKAPKNIWKSINNLSVEDFITSIPPISLFKRMSTIRVSNLDGFEKNIRWNVMSKNYFKVTCSCEWE